ncbi:MAG: MurR/RpiR family transcriptional regulator [Alphaproteobacteria bacterium]
MSTVSLDDQPEQHDDEQAGPDAPSILVRLRDAYNSLSPQLRQSARYLLDRPDEVAFSSMRQIAGRAGVQPATMVRLAQRLGYAGYDELREPFRNELRRRPTGYGMRARDLVARTAQRRGGKALARLAREMVQADRDNLSTSIEAIGADQLAEAARLMARARRLYIVGQRSLFPAAFYTHYACGMFRENVVLLDGHGGTFADALRGVSEHDTMVVFSFSPYSRASIQAAAYAHRRGAAVIGISDSLVSPLANLTRHMLLVATDSPALFRSVVPALAVSQILVAQVLAQGGQQAIAAVARSEQQLEAFGAYWSEDAAPVALAGEESDAPLADSPDFPLAGFPDRIA